MERRLFNKYLAIIIVIILCAIFLYHLRPYLNAFFGALILFFLFYPIYKLFVVNFKIGKSFSAILIIILTLIIIIVPLIFIVNAASKEISYVTDNSEELLSKIDIIDAKYPAIHLKETINNNLPTITTFGGKVLINQINNIIKVIILLFIMYATLYYLFIYHDSIQKKVKDLLPFNKENSNRLVSNFRRVTMGILISTGLIAIIQGLLLGLSFFLFGVKGAILWGIVAAIFSFLPILGLTIIYIPFSVIYILNQNYLAGFGILICGALISLSDYLIRPPLQRRFGDIHPLISIIGLFIGISAFGFIGIIMGPLLITYVLLTYNMFMQEYIKN